MAATYTIKIAALPTPPEGCTELCIVVRRWRGSPERFEPHELQSAIDYWVRQGIEDNDLQAECVRYERGDCITLRAGITRDKQDAYKWDSWKEV